MWGIGVYVVKRLERKMIKSLFLLIYLGFISLEDYRYRSLSLFNLIGGLVISLAISFFLGELKGPYIIFKIILLTGFLSFMAFFRKSLGFGDIMVFLVLGILLGVEEMVRVLFLSSILLLLVGVLTYSRLSYKDRFPFIPFIAGGYILELVIKSTWKGW